MSRSRVRIGTARKEPAADDGEGAGRSSADRGSAVNRGTSENGRNSAAYGSSMVSAKRTVRGSSVDDKKRADNKISVDDKKRADNEISVDGETSADSGHIEDVGMTVNREKSAGGGSIGNRRKNDSRSWTPPMRKFGRS